MTNYFEQLPIEIIAKIIISDKYYLSLMFVNKSLYKMYNDNIDIFAHYISEDIKKNIGMRSYLSLIAFITYIMPELEQSKKIYKKIILNMNISQKILDDITLSHKIYYSVKTKDIMYFYTHQLYIKYVYILANRCNVNTNELIIYHTIFHNTRKLRKLFKLFKLYRYDDENIFTYLLSYYYLSVKINAIKETKLIKFIIKRSSKEVIMSIDKFITEILKRKYNKLYIIGYLLNIKLPYNIDIREHCDKYKSLLLENYSLKKI